MAARGPSCHGVVQRRENSAMLILKMNDHVIGDVHPLGPGQMILGQVKNSMTVQNLTTEGTLFIS